MRNIIGPLNENVICKYDLKGSTLKRETNLDVDNLGQIVLKDNNFIDIEHYLFMDRQEIKRLRRNTTSDAYFLCDMELMDYSLFLVKISLTKKEIKEIFEDEEINKFCDKNARRCSINDYTNDDKSFDINESLKSNFLKKNENEISKENIDENENNINSYEDHSANKVFY